MSLIRLRTFVEVYRQRSISGAARTLNLTQPAVSQHISGLEAAIGRSLFDRQARGVEPTSAAKELAADIGDKLDDAESALASARARSIELTGALQIIGHADFLAEVVSRQLKPLLEEGIRIRMQSGNHESICRLLIEGECDLGVSGMAPDNPRLRSELLFTDDVIAVAAPAVVKRLVAAKDFVTALEAEPILAYSLALPLIDAWLALNRIEITTSMPAMVGQDLRTLRTLLIDGFGWSTLPAYLCRPHIERGELREVPAPVGHSSRDYHLIWTPSALRQPRVAHARQALLWRLRGSRRVE
ncbi:MULTISPECIES: LysR family transcriptional regulator [unclassified Pseudomonas]|uniref:LysR family transcriptional regulator n=1 Tax=unclassified Pseudomonas TaxID=196821 RepID=UPI002AC90ED2|nr:MULTISPECIES: LysR family transcriptional regulator [unclassified Pseudomonas]MEB0047541.1 LysR family transcriptional regulator [Pseudomonas sp. Dout3]MEB0097984.1 LysR family transcriptional regulator [Pseudomonas sp. DC1.2]WPX57011.1 LysR family transcriptional regulator [Pseudomonas sp. DC1.2]